MLNHVQNVQTEWWHLVAGASGEIGFCPNCTSIFHFSKPECNAAVDHFVFEIKVYWENDNFDPQGFRPVHLANNAHFNSKKSRKEAPIPWKQVDQVIINATCVFLSLFCLSPSLW